MKLLGNIKDPLLALIVVTVLSCVLKFLAEGVTFTVHGNLVNLGHTDSLAYGSILTPLLMAHGYIKGNIKEGDVK